MRYALALLIIAAAAVYLAVVTRDATDADRAEAMDEVTKW